MRDLRFAWRALARTPGFTIAAVLTLGLGIGANTAIFSAVKGILLRPLPVEELDRLIVLQSDAPGLNLRRFPVNAETAFEMNTRQELFEAVGGHRKADITLTGFGEPTVIGAAHTAGDLFRVLRLNPQRGRFYGADASRPGNEHIAVVTDSFWERVSNRDPSFLGRKIQLNGRPYEVIGILPRGFRYPIDVDVWIPMSSSDPVWRPASILTTLARPQPGVALEKIGSELRSYAENWGTPKGWGMTIVTQPFLEFLAGRMRPVLLFLTGAVCVVLLIACVNVASLQLVRVTSRTTEMAIRTALGASRAALIRASLMESLLLAAAGGSLGLLVASSLLDGFAVWGASHLALFNRLPIDIPVMLFCAAVSLTTGVVLGILPALRSSNPNVEATLRSAGRGATLDRKPHRLLSGFAAAQVGLAFLLLTAALLLTRSLAGLIQSDSGFRSERVITMTLKPSESRYAQKPALVQLYSELQERLRQLPAVERIALTTSLPLQPHSSSPFRIVDRTVNPDQPQPHAEALVVNPEYFDILGIPLLRGRNFNQGDTASASRVVMIDAQLAEEFFPNEDPLGRQIVHKGPAATIIGIVGSTSQLEVGGPAKATAYYSLQQSPQNPVIAIVRTPLDPGDLTAMVRPAISGIDPEIPIFQVRELKELINRSLGARQFGAYVLAGFAAMAIALSVIGIYGVLSYITRERAFEFGIRLTLGAQRSDIVRSVILRGAWMAGIGLATGLAGSVVSGRFIAALLYRVSPNDPLTLFMVAAFLYSVSLLASILPAWRVSRLDPAAALRSE